MVSDNMGDDNQVSDDEDLATDAALGEAAAAGEAASADAAPDGAPEGNVEPPVDGEEARRARVVEDEPRNGYVKAGTQEFWVEARGRFDEKGLSGYAPSVESERLLVDVPIFEGPLDLLLHLIRKHALDILDIPIAVITERYIKVIDDMRKLDLDIAGEFLVMASQLAHIKSKMLLPKEDQPEGEEEVEDPRAALVRRLLEYQKFKDAAEMFAERAWLGRDVFTADPNHKPFNPDTVPVEDPTAGLARFDVEKLIKLFDSILKRNKQQIVHEVVLERLGVGQRINELVDFAQTREAFTFTDIVDHFGGVAAGRRSIIVTFLAVLEMTKFKLLKIHQAQEDGQIYISPVQENFNSGDDFAVDDYDTQPLAESAP